LALATLVGGMALLVLVHGAEAQEELRLFGWVQWISSTSMQVMTASGASVAIDLKEVDQSSYRALRYGEMIVVDGVVSGDRRRIVAREIWRDAGSEAP
jgi:hypothetical protein